jgi:hypothetical protein
VRSYFAFASALPLPFLRSVALRINSSQNGESA